MNVGVYVFFPTGGIARYTDAWARALAEVPEVSVEVACSVDFPWGEGAPYRTWPGLLRVAHPLAPVRRARFLAAQLANPLRFAEHAAHSGARLLHFANVNHLTFPLWRGRLARLGVPVAITAHDVRREKPILSRRWEDDQLKAVYRFASALFVHSATQATELAAFADVPPDRIHVVPHGPYAHGAPSEAASVVRERLAIPPGRQIALFFGQIRDEKNLEAFLRALAASGADVHLVVAGRAGGRHAAGERYRSLVRELDLEERTTLQLDHIPDAEVANLFNGADWIALPYARRFNSQSGVLNVAMQYRRPVLVTPAPLLRESVEGADIGVVAGGDDVRSLAEAIRAMHQRHRESAYYDFERFQREHSWAENVRRTLLVYRRLLER